MTLIYHFRKFRKIYFLLDLAFIETYEVFLLRWVIYMYSLCEYCIMLSRILNNFFVLDWAHCLNSTAGWLVFLLYCLSGSCPQTEEFSSFWGRTIRPFIKILLFVLINVTCRSLSVCSAQAAAARPRAAEATAREGVHRARDRQSRLHDARRVPRLQTQRTSNARAHSTRYLCLWSSLTLPILFCLLDGNHCMFVFVYSYNIRI